MVLIQVMLGGITRITGSGLSITEWDVIMGTLPPRNADAWNEAFDKYRQTPQFRLINPDMDLAGFKRIYFWEYIHRNWARLIGIVFLLPFIWFLLFKKLSRAWKLKLFILFILGALQGLAGWVMVASGLIDRPWVSPYDLTLHLLLALLVYSYLLWLVFSLRRNAVAEDHPGTHRTAGWLLAIVAIQIAFGGFMAGTHAGQQYNTWPLMNGSLFPPGMFSMPDILGNPSAVNFIHRSFAIVVCIAVIYFYMRNRMFTGRRIRALNLCLLLTVFLQITLGICTLLTGAEGINVYLGVAHQVGACLLLGICVALLFFSKPRSGYPDFPA